MSKKVFTFLIVLSMAAVTGAQTKVAGTTECGKPDPEHMIDIGDQPGHAFSISQVKCTWTKPLEYNGIKNKEGTGTGFNEISGDTSSFRGFYLDTMENGDTVHYNYEGTAKMKDGMVESSEHKWTIIRATGKLEGLKASGTCKGKSDGEGGMIYECEGEYKSAT